jgi:hypothetical protein
MDGNESWQEIHELLELNHREWSPHSYAIFIEPEWGEPANKSLEMVFFFVGVNG